MTTGPGHSVLISSSIVSWSGSSLWQGQPSDHAATALASWARSPCSLKLAKAALQEHSQSDYTIGTSTAPRTVQIIKLWKTYYTWYMVWFNHDGGVTGVFLGTSIHLLLAANCRLQATGPLLQATMQASHKPNAPGSRSTGLSEHHQAVQPWLQKILARWPPRPDSNRLQLVLVLTRPWRFFCSSYA